MREFLIFLFFENICSIRISELPEWVQIPPLVEKSASQNYFLLSDEELNLPCKSTGNPKPTILWYKDGAEISENKDFKVLNDGSLQITAQGKF